MQLKAVLRTPRLDFARCKEVLHERLSEALAQAGCKWLVAAMTEPTDVGIPIWSGASVATFSKLASKVGLGMSINTAGDAPDRIRLGEENSEATFTPDRDSGIYSFSYVTTLPHLIVNEYHDATQWGFNLKHPGPYHFQEKGQEAFRDYFERDFQGMPDWRQCITVQTISVG